MPMILRTMHDRLAFRFGRQTALRSTCHTVEQLQAQIDRLKEQMRFNAAEYEKQIAVLIRDLTRAEYKLAQRDMIDASASAPSPSAMVH
jgi:predicted phage tail protein